MEKVSGLIKHEFLPGSAGKEDEHNSSVYKFPHNVRVKDKSSIVMNGPQAHEVPFQIFSKTLTVDGGAQIYGKHIILNAVNITVDDGGNISVNDGGYVAGEGPAPGVAHKLGHSGASHGGMGGRGWCGGFVACRLRRNSPYGTVYLPKDFGSGGVGK